MSTRFDAASDRISFAGAMFAVGSGFTITAWAWVSVDTNDNATFARLHASSGGSTIVTWATESDGLAGPNYFTGGGSVSNATNMAVGAWRKIAISCSGTTGKSYVNTIGGTTEVDSGTVGVGTPVGITLGGRAPADSAEFFNGRLAYVRVWSAELSQVEIEAEWASATPVRTSGLWANWPLTDSTDLTDHSGNGRNLTAGSTAVSTEADPPLAANVTGTAASAFGALAGTATGTRKVLATAAGSFGALAGSATGTRKVTATAATAYGAMSGTATGTRKVNGTAAAGYATLAGAGSGLRTVIATGAATYGGLVGHATEPSNVTGTGHGTFAGLHGRATAGDTTAVPTGSWYGLLDIYAEARQIREEERDRPPVACPNDGEPLVEGPDGDLFCRFDGWRENQPSFAHN